LDKLEAADVTSTAQESRFEPGDETLAEPNSHVAVPEAQEDRGKWYLVREIVETIALTVIIFAAINLLTGRFRIEGPSMLPNLHQGQYLIINKVVYRLHPPRRGDIIVFHHPRNPNRDLIKRVVGLPGEAVEIRNGQVYVGSALLDEPYVLYQGRYSGHYELGPDEYFVLGDNRPNSEDSRNWGVLKGDQIVGKAWISYWPPGELGTVRHFGYPDSPAAEKQGYGQEIGLLIMDDWFVH
jgi:signal peptidase I